MDFIEKIRQKHTVIEKIFGATGISGRIVSPDLAAREPDARKKLITRIVELVMGSRNPELPESLNFSERAEMLSNSISTLAHYYPFSEYVEPKKEGGYERKSQSISPPNDSMIAFYNKWYKSIISDISAIEWLWEQHHKRIIQLNQAPMLVNLKLIENAKDLQKRYQEKLVRIKETEPDGGPFTDEYQRIMNDAEKSIIGLEQPRTSIMEQFLKTINLTKPILVQISDELMLVNHYNDRFSNSCKTVFTILSIDYFDTGYITANDVWII